jgi:CMP-N,N'-diacetyllegionaminic acid synthase
MIATEGSSFLAVVPARGGSKRVPRKNIREIAGRPLLAWTIEHVRRCSTPMRLIVSTDDPVIRDVALKEGAEVLELRPPDLATDESPTEPVLIRALDTLAPDTCPEHVVLLPPTSPIRDDGSLDAAIELYQSSGADSLVSVTEASPLLWKGPPENPLPLYDISNRPRQQSIASDLRRYRENGSIVISSSQFLRQSGNRLGGKMVMFIMAAHEGIDIDTEYDLWMAERWLRGKNAD